MHRNVAVLPEVTVKLIALDKLPVEAPEWPWSPWATGRLIRTGSLGCIKVGRRVFVTPELLEAFVASHTNLPGSEGGAR